jgi:hypothetical protein
MLVQPLTGSDILLCGIQSTPDAVRKRGTKEPEDQAHGRALFAPSLRVLDFGCATGGPRIRSVDPLG